MSRQHEQLGPVLQAKQFSQTFDEASDDSGRLFTKLPTILQRTASTNNRIAG